MVHPVKKSFLERIRKEYGNTPLLEEEAFFDPLQQFSLWLKEAITAGVMEPNGMVLSTALPSGRVSSRTVLLKGIDKEGGFIFYTNYTSRKAGQLSHNHAASLCFWWKEIYRQVVVEGVVEKTTVKVSRNYFAKRPRGAQIAAWASQQSTPLVDREALEAAYAFFKNKFQKQKIPYPPQWGGYRFIPDRLEFWQGRKNRLHDRLVYVKANGQWVRSRLSP